MQPRLPLILLPQSPQCWDYQHVPPGLAVLEFELEALHFLGRCSTTRPPTLAPLLLSDRVYNFFPWASLKPLSFYFCVLKIGITGMTPHQAL
jgi:hypothetical protein